MKPVPNPVDSPSDKIRLVAANTEDDHFLNEVYFSTRFEEFAGVGWNTAQIKQFLAMQSNFQRQSYRMQFPAAENSIIWFENEKIGRLVVNRGESELRLVDISLLPQCRNAGIGTKLINGLLSEAGEKDLPVRLHVAVKNQPAFRLYQKLGFRITGTDELDHSMEWRSDFVS